MNAPAWVPVSQVYPPEGVVLDTKIDDSRGERNVQQLKRSGSLWFFPDMSMYVYYSPTHWRHAAARPPSAGGRE